MEERSRSGRLEMQTQLRGLVSEALPLIQDQGKQVVVSSSPSWPVCFLQLILLHCGLIDQFFKWWMQ